MSYRDAQLFYDKPLPKYLDPKTVLIYRPHPVLHPTYAEREGALSSSIVLHSCLPDAYKQRYKI